MEKNINEYNKDIVAHGSYLYSQNILSSKISTQRQSDEIIRLIRKYFPQKLKILDVGCGEGKYTMVIFNIIKPKLIVGVDSAIKAIETARKNIPKNAKGRIMYDLGNAYNLKKYKKHKFDLILIRGVIHHLYKPYDAVRELTQASNAIIILEPNGYNPILKIIERISEYHIRHEEKSYSPSLLDSWFKKSGFQVKESKIFGLVPYFCGNWMAKFLKKIEPLLERILIIKTFTCGSYVALYNKTSH